MSSSREHWATTSGRRWRGGRGLAVALAAAALGGAVFACARSPHGASTREPTDTPASDASGQEPTARDATSGEATRAVDLAAFVTDSLVAQQGTCFSTERGPGRSRLIYSMLPTEASYLRLAVVTSPDGTRPVMVDLARGLTGNRILYATLAPSARLVRLETFRSASDRRPLVTDVPLEDPVAQRLLFLAERALTLRCRGA